MTIRQGIRALRALVCGMLCFLLTTAKAQEFPDEIPEVAIEIQASQYFRPALQFAWPDSTGPLAPFRARVQLGLEMSGSLLLLGPGALDSLGGKGQSSPEARFGSITVLHPFKAKPGSDSLAVQVGLRDRQDKKDFAHWSMSWTPAGTEAAADSLVDAILYLLTGKTSLVDSRILLSRRGRDGDNIFVCDHYGGDLRPLTHTASPKFSPRLSPDGRWLVYGVVREGSGADLFIQGLDSRMNALGTAEPLVAGPQSDTSPAWSPDGRWLAFASTREGNTDIYLLPIENGRAAGRERRITFERSIETSPAFSPDGRHLVYTSDRGGGLQLYRISVDGLESQRLSWFGYANDCPDWSPDGQWIAFVTRERKGFQLAVMRADGSEAMKLTDAPGNHFNPVWSPDGTQLAYSWNGVTWVCFADGQGKRRLLAGNGASPDWTAGARTREGER
jgi:TolB protein